MTGESGVTGRGTLSLVAVRHGETEWIERGLLHGRLDSPLSEAGRRHAHQTADRLKGESFDALYTSPLGRAVQTAEILGSALGLTPQPLNELREVDFGVLEGRPRKLLDAEGLPGRLVRHLARALFLLTGEPWPHVAERVRTVIRLLVEQHPAGRVLVVTHWSVLSLLTAFLLEGDASHWRRYGPWQACGLSEFVLVRDGEVAWRALRLNDTSHLNGKGSS